MNCARTKPADPPRVNFANSATSPRADRALTRAIALLAFAAFASGLVRVSDPLLPQIAADFAVSVGAASIVVTAYALTHGSMQFVTGPIGDRFGKYRRRRGRRARSPPCMVLLCGLANRCRS